MNFDLCIDSCHHHDQGTDSSSLPQTPLYYSFVVTFSIQLSIPGNHCLFSITIVFVGLSFTMSYKWNHVVCNFLRLASFIQNNDSEIHPSWCMYLYSTVIFIAECGRTTACLFTHPLKNIWVVSRLWRRWLNVLWIVTSFLCEYKFPFSLDKYLGVGLLGHTVRVCLHL